MTDGYQVVAGVREMLGRLPESIRKLCDSAAGGWKTSGYQISGKPSSRGLVSWRHDCQPAPSKLTHTLAIGLVAGDSPRFAYSSIATLYTAPRSVPKIRLCITR